MPNEEVEIFVKSKSIADIKEEIFKYFPSLIPYSNSCSLYREFGEFEECGTNLVTFNISPGKVIELVVIYEKC